MSKSQPEESNMVGSPKSALRNQYDVNSPKAGSKSFNWGGASSDNKGPAGSAANNPNSLMTQMTPEEAERLKKLQMQNAAAADDQEAESKAPTSCFQSCCRCFFASKSVKNEPNSENETPKTSEIEVLPQQIVVEADVDAREPTPESESIPDGLLGPINPEDKGKKCLVLDLDETLVHSSFTPVECTFQVPIEIEGIRHEVYVLKRPFCDEFLLECSKHFEIVVFTASLSQYANPVMDVLDVHKVIKHRLFRESCVLHNQSAYVKDMSIIGRKIKDSLIIDNSPLSYLFQPRNAIGCTSWFGDMNDTELRDMLPVLCTTIKDCKDVRNILNANTLSLKQLMAKAKKPSSAEAN